jgi:hypothetical protein
VATCNVFAPNAAVGARGVPVKIGLSLSALSARFAARVISLARFKLLILVSLAYLTARLHNYIFSNKPITINKGCKCPFRWSMEYLMSDGELEERIEEIESIEVLETDFGYLINHKKK